jgi:SPP1 gp7 family putative phage head morphogenesis protein
LSDLGGAFAFDATDPAAAAWAAEHAGELVTSIHETTRAMVRSVLLNEFVTNDLPRNSAKFIRDMVGLTPQQQARISAFRAKVLAAQPGEVIRSGTMKFKVSKQGVDKTALSRVIAKGAKRALVQRGHDIAITETMQASNQGQLMAWEQARAKGILDDSMSREWITAADERRCPICGAADGQVVKFDQPFQLVGGGTVMTPPAHPRCRCTQGLVGTA